MGYGVNGANWACADGTRPAETSREQIPIIPIVPSLKATRIKQTSNNTPPIILRIYVQLEAAWVGSGGGEMSVW
jgi:hypothetical protein